MTKRISDIAHNNDDFIYGWLGFTGQTKLDKTCLLLQENSTLKLIIPFKGEPDEASGWFLSKDFPFNFNEMNNVILPERIWVEDINSNKKFVLSEYRVTAQSSSLGSPKGKGTITPRRVIIGNPHFDYSEINTLSSSSPEYLRWSGLSSIETKIAGDEGNPYILKSYQAGFSKKDPVLIFSGKVSLALHSYGGFKRTNNWNSSVTISDQVSFESTSEELTSFYDHMEVHQQFRKLVCISAWRDIGFKDLRVRRNDDYDEFIDGSHSDASFRDVISCEFAQWEIPSKSKKSFYLHFADIGADGLSTWFMLFKRFAKPLNEIAYIATNHAHLAVESQVVDFGIAFDELGRAMCQLKSLNIPGTIQESISYVIEDCESNYGKFPLAKSDLASDIANSYNAIKHFQFERKGMSREEWTDPSRLVEVMFACKFLALFWIAKRIKCPYEAIIQRLQGDSMLKQAIARWQYI